MSITVNNSVYTKPTSTTMNYYLNPKIKIDDSDPNNHKIIAVQDIKKGELLVVDSVLCGSSVFLHMACALDKTLFDRLLPRTLPFKPYPSKQTEQQTLDEFHLECKASVESNNQKIGSNCLVSSYMNAYLLGSTLSKFNHCCKYNTLFFDVYENEEDASNTTVEFDDNHTVMCVSCQPIKAGEECFITYGNYLGHTETEDFKCSCGFINEQALEYHDNMCALLQNSTLMEPIMKEAYDRLQVTIQLKSNVVEKIIQNRTTIKKKYDELKQWCKIDTKMNI